MKQLSEYIIAGVLGAALPLGAYAQTDMTQTEAAQTPEPALTWEICNETSFVLRAAYATSEQGQVRIRGWENAFPGACIQAKYSNPNAPRYLYAESLPIHRGGIREWKGTVELCASEENFVAEASSDCALKNLETRNYMAVKPTETRTTLIEPSDYGEKAETAGIQRLLSDAGYKITRVDGLPGRRTNRSLRDFKKAAELDSGAKGEVLFTALKDAAEGSIKSVGIEICNQSSQKIWGAIAYQENGSWQSRGWWGIETAACSHIYTQSLIGKEAHIYALQENPNLTNPADIQADKRLRSVATTPAQFCIAEARFSALGREYCTEGGYDVANFRPLPADEDGTKVTLTDTDFVETSASGLRR